jgi:hypothetical protein
MRLMCQNQVQMDVAGNPLRLGVLLPRHHEISPDRPGVLRKIVRPFKCLTAVQLPVKSTCDLTKIRQRDLRWWQLFLSKMLGQPQFLRASARAICRTETISFQSHSRCPVEYAKTAAAAMMAIVSFIAASIVFLLIIVFRSIV